VFGEKEFNLVVTHIHPPLGDIKFLSGRVGLPKEDGREKGEKGRG
jgi:hypothetical protein